MNSKQRRHNKSQPNYQLRRANSLPPTPPINNSPQGENASAGDNNSNNNIQQSPYDNKRKWQYADTIAVLALLVAVAMTVVTYQLFKQTLTSTKAATDSADAAKVSSTATKKSADLQKLALDSQISAKKQSDASDVKKFQRENDLFELQKKSYASNEKDRIARFKRDTVAIGLQIKSLKQNQDQFTKQYEPYLKLTVDSIVVRFNKLYVFYTMLNLTNTPVKVVNIKSSAYVRGTQSIIPVKMPEAAPENLYIIKETPQQRFFPIPEANPKEIKFVVSGVWSIFWDVEFEYINQITDEKRCYIVSVKLNKTRGENPPYPVFSRNDNIPK